MVTSGQEMFQQKLTVTLGARGVPARGDGHLGSRDIPARGECHLGARGVPARGEGHIEARGVLTGEGHQVSR
ncbi:hypothetical protein F511_14241 [Dorcoceras hygrometricum]|uniref:Uncharacterized protein n=1 Tax=Dorcoceras hygrometricum TaxID=472368 RepID=A0A2Z7BNM9_9LAMI|nr:hypothetical protein F511_14241 [Dorcoceras hygrometricum]